MFTAEVQFTIPGSVDDAESLVYDLLGPWRKNGQILNSGWSFTQKGGKYRTFVMIFQEDSLSEKYDNKYARKARQKLAELATNSLKITILGEDPFNSEICTCKKPSFYILYTHFLSLESPIRCGDCLGTLPAYKILPKEVDLHDGIDFWRETYKECDGLQMGCEVGERFGTREMSRHDSSLSKIGISICNDITEGTGTSAYYYLYRYNSKSLASEKRRKCPSCGGDWLLDEPLHDRFDFKCDRCRLLSNIGFAVR